MFRKFLTHIDDQFLFLKNKRLLVAVSGGVDSMVLSDLVKQSQMKFAIAHCNFGLRGIESDNDQIFVKDYCQRNNIPFFTKRFETKLPKHSTQMAARSLRYEWFKSLLEIHSYDYVLTAHHADDDLETLLINLTRGSGVAGLSGIPTLNKYIARPLLPFSKEDILLYANQNKIQWREDSSNQKSDYYRNQIRHQVIPNLKKGKPELLQQVQKTIQFLRDTNTIKNNYFSSLLNEISSQFHNEIHFSIDSLKQLQPLKTHLFELFSPYGFTSTTELVKFLDASSGKELQSKSHRLIHHRKQLIVAPLIHQEPLEFEVSKKGIQAPISLSIEECAKITPSSPYQIFLDPNTIQFPLTLRKSQSGDVFYPEGMKGKKKISKFFKDDKMSILAKESQWLLCSGDDIVWVVGKRVDRRFVLNSNTTEPLKITFHER